MSQIVTIECDWCKGCFCLCLESRSKSFMMTLRVVPSKIPDQERKRVQYQDSWGCPIEMKLRNLDIWGMSEKSSVEALGLWHLLPYNVLFYILGGVPSEIQTEKVNVDFYQGFKSVWHFVTFLWHFVTFQNVTMSHFWILWQFKVFVTRYVFFWVLAKPKIWHKTYKSHKCHKPKASTGLFSDAPQISRFRYVSLEKTSETPGILILATFTFQVLNLARNDSARFFLSWGSKTQPNHWTKRMASTRIAT